MFMRSILVVCLLAAASSAFAQGSKNAADLPGPVADWIAKARQDCPKGFSDAGAVEKIPLTGDGRAGYAIDPHKFACDAAPGLYGGLGPASIELFVTLPSGQVVHAGGVVALGFKVTPYPDGGAPVIAFDTHEVKERAGSVDRYRWDGSRFAIMDRRSLALPPDEN
jgi:hypothetical protein